ncbi:PAS domain S-box protein [Iodobacter sp. CM08]|uniref:PAS domain-containing hybrid sensor histidine kinase/response regulator n=1 Tax=Iodobacter sp. CM08 TaxID=3085902 RepID=UPI002980D7BD|nr:PAS domain S-box protein [Iodobacter sp. CM08]MDW5419135.1 PAS domain S-box protein [Iodobacter sp. CM08]
MSAGKVTKKAKTQVLEYKPSLVVPLVTPPAVFCREIDASLAAERALQAKKQVRDKGAELLENLNAMSLQETQQLLHELRVHQIELEMQNEELRRTQIDLDAAHKRYFDLYDLAPVGYCTISAEGRILQANLTAATLLGSNRRALVNRPFSQFIAKADQDIFYFLGKQLLETREAQIGELRMVKSSGLQFWAHLVASATSDQEGSPDLRIVLSDITERKQAEEAQLKEGSLQRAIFNSANFSSIATDARGVIQIFNVGAECMLGYTAEEVMNKITPADISDPQEMIERAKALSIELATPISPGFEALVFKASRGIEDIYELTYIRKDGSRFPAAVSVTALRDVKEMIIGYLLIGTDNTARKLVEAERALLDQALQLKNTELERATAVAEKANLAKSDFLSSMSHELRTPLNAILGFAQLLESGSPEPTPSQTRSIDQILKAGWYLLELINEILDLALIESGKLSLSMEPILLTDVMRECETMIEPQAKGRDISVVFPSANLPYFVYADQTRLKQVLINLLSNAIKYNKEGGSVAVECTLSLPNSIRISVRDTGAGLTPEQLSQLFQSFNRLGQEANVEGTGIGLIVSKRLVELMGGVIGVESHFGEGSTFWLELNLASEPLLIAPMAEPTIVVPPSLQGASYTMLYVEDNPANLMLVESLIMRRPDIHLLSARDGKRGIEIARTSLPDIILMDINLPGISGVDALQILAQDPNTKHIPVVAISANAVVRDIEKGLAAGFFRYLTKPIKVQEFMDTLDFTLAFVKTEANRINKKEKSS